MNKILSAVSPLHSKFVTAFIVGFLSSVNLIAQDITIKFLFDDVSLTLQADAGATDIVEFDILNTTAADLTISDVTITGPDAGEFTFFGGSSGSPPYTALSNPNDNDSLIRPTVSVLFQPTSAGTKNATLNIFSDSPESPHTFPIVGAANVALEPVLNLEVTNQPSGVTEFDLLSINVGEPEIITVTIQNSGNTTLNITQLQLTNSSQFRFSTSFSLPLALAPTEAVVLDVTASATYPVAIPSPGISTIKTNISIIHDDPNQSSPLLRELQFFERSPDPSTSVSELNFGDINPGSSSARSFTITNNSVNPNIDGDLIITGFDFGVNGDVFSTSTAFPIRLATGESSLLDVTFSPDVFETISSTITVLANVSQTLNVEARGAVKQLTPGSSVVDFGDIRRDDNSGQAVADFFLEPTGGLPVTITDISFSGADPSSFFSAQQLPFEITERVNWGVRFLPGRGMGTRSATMTITSDAVNSPHVVEVTANSIFPPILSLSEASISIDQLDRLNTLDTGFTISNTGTETLTITSVSLSAAVENQDQFRFVNLPSFPIDLASGEELTIDVRFQPTKAADIAATVNVVSNSSTGSLQLVSLFADVVSSIAFISNEFFLPQDSLKFGQVSTAISVTDSIKVVNDGDGDLVISDIMISGFYSDAYAIPGVNYPIVIPAGDSLSFPVAFQPTTTLATNFATLTIKSNNVLGDMSLELTGIGVSPVLSFNSSLSFPRSLVDSTSEIVQEISNFGNVPATIYGFELTGANSDLFSISGLKTPVTIDAGITTSVKISFNPVVQGTFSAQLEMLSDVVNGPHIAAISGTGFTAPVFYTKDTLATIADVVVGTVAVMKIPVQNIGTQNLELSSAFLEEGSSGVFSAGPTGFGLPLTIAPGAVDTITVDYSPVLGGTQTAVLSIATNDQSASKNTPSNRARIFLSGTAIGPIASYPTELLDFDSTFVGFDKVISFDVTNVGVGELRMDYVYNDPNALFSVVYEGLDTPINPDMFIPVSLATGDTQQINVVFTPQEFVSSEDTVKLVFRNSKNERYEEKIAVKGIGVEPPLVKFGALTIAGDDFIRSQNIKVLTGNVHVGDLQLGERVSVNLTEQTITGNGDVYVTDVPKNGAIQGGTVVLRQKFFKYYVNGEDSTLSLSPAEGEEGINPFKIIGIGLELNDIVITEKGVRAGGKFPLPSFIFGEDAGFNLENILISKQTGVDIAGKFALEAPFTVYELFSLESVVLEFDSFNDCFSGSGSVSSEAGAFELSIDAEIVMKNAGLEAVSLEVETFPGIPLGQTGMALAGGNGAIAGLQIPPISIELGVDLVPVPPGANKVVRFDNVGFKYTFGTSLTAGGKLLLFGMEAGDAEIEGNAIGITADAYMNLLEIYKGNVGFSVQPFEEKLKISGNAGMSVEIPQIPADVGGVVAGAINEFLPITLAEVSTSFTEQSISGSFVYPPIPFKFSAGITLDENDIAKFTIGGEFTLYNELGASTGSRMSVGQLPYAMKYENNPVLAKQAHLEGKSIVINSEISAQGGRLDNVENTEFPFTLNAGLEAVIIRVEGAGEVPDFSLVLPTGQEVTPENAMDLGYLHTVNAETNQGHILLANTLPGDYLIKIEGSGEFEIDIAGAEFGPTLNINEVNYDDATDNVEIIWEDEDLDSDAKVSFFYDVDQSGGNGQIIVAELSEDDDTDRFSWDVSEIDNGTYYIYGTINDSLHTPTIAYAEDSIVINKASEIEVPVLQSAKVIDTTVQLAWSAVANVKYYLVYYAEEKSVTLRSQVFNAGAKVSYSIPNLKPGRKYQFAVVAVDSSDIRSNLSNIREVSYVSEAVNNIPMIDIAGIPDHVKVGELYEAIILASDGDEEDVLTYSLMEAPEGMTLSEDKILWTPDETQIGSNQVRLKVEDPNLAADSVRFTIIVVNEQSSKASITFNSTRFNGLEKTVNVTLQDAGLNNSATLIESQSVTLYSTTDRTGFNLTLRETSSNSGTFKGVFGFTKGGSANGSIQISTADSVFVSYQDEFPEETVTRFVLFEESATPNELPTAISINNSRISSDAVEGDLVGVLSTVDPDDETHMYQLVNGVGADDNSFFVIDGQALTLGGSLDNETDSIFTIRVRSIDTKNGIYEQVLTITREMRTDELLTVEPDALLNEVVLYPNPTSRKVFITIDSEKGAITMTILSSDGRRIRTEIFEKRWNDSKVSMNVADLPAGIYFIQIEQQGQVVNKRLVKE